MIERLIHTLQALAAPAHVQLTHFPDFVAKTNALALDYADALLLAIDCPQVQLESGQRLALERLDTYLDQMSRSTNTPLWTEDAIRCGVEWEMIRVLARDALAVLGVAHDLPRPSVGGV